MILDCMWCCGIVSILFLRRTFPTFGKIISKDFVEAIKWRGLHFRGMCKVPARITKVQKQRELQRSRTLMTCTSTWSSGWFGVSCVKAWLYTMSSLYYRWTFIRVLLSPLEAAAAELIIFSFLQIWRLTLNIIRQQLQVLRSRSKIIRLFLSRWRSPDPASLNQRVGPAACGNCSAKTNQGKVQSSCPWNRQLACNPLETTSSAKMHN